MINFFRVYIPIKYLENKINELNQLVYLLIFKISLLFIMEGDLLQLKAKDYNGLDKHLSLCNDEIKQGKGVSFFQSPFNKINKPTNFSINTRRIQPDNEFDFGKTSIFKIPRYGDKIIDMIFEINLPTLSNVGYVNTIGYALFDYIEIEIGGRIITRHYDTWMDVHDKLMVDSDYRAGIDEMVLRFDSHFDDSFRGGLFLAPLKFWFCGDPENSFPLVALSHQDLIIRVKLKPFNKVWLSDSNQTPTEIPKIDTVNLLVDYVRLGDLERTSIYNSVNRYLIKQVQYTSIDIPSGINEYKASLEEFNYPVVELIWILRTKSRETEKDWFNYGISNSVDVDPVIEAKIMFGEKERVEWHSNKFFRIMQPYRRHSNIPNDYVYMYSFSLYPENKTQPAGSCNFSEIKDKYLHLKLNNNINENITLQIFAVNYNTIIIEDGYCILEKCLAP